MDVRHAQNRACADADIRPAASGRPWHALSAPETLAALGSSPEGLEPEEALRRLSHFGPNLLPGQRRRHPLLRFLAHFNSVLIYVLLASAAVTAFLGHLTDTAVIIAVVVVNAAIGFLQEGRAEQAMAAIHGLVASRTSVLRGGKRRVIDAAEVVPGDIVLMEGGEKVPADLRLIEVNGLIIQEAILTGESAAAEKSVHPAARDAPLGDRHAMAFAGTLTASGTGRGVVVATAGATELGRIGALVSGVETLVTPLTRQMDAFARWLSLLILVFAGLILIHGYFIGHRDFATLFMAVVSLTVAAIPEGLPAVLTITLAVGVQAMARRNAIVRRLPAIETLGSVSVICTDKTGTLTRNEMMAVTVATARSVYSITGEGYAPGGAVHLGPAIIDPAEHSPLREAGLAAALCNDATLHRTAQGWHVHGDPMEGALLSLAAKLLGGEAAPGGWRRVHEIPFDPRHRYMAVLAHDPDGRAFAFVKGAPERILAMCGTELAPDCELRPIDMSFWHREADAIAARGQRVLALASARLVPGQEMLRISDIDGRLGFIGLAGLIDPPRPEAIAAVAACRGAGISVKMITGDHAGTAAAIGREIGLAMTGHVLTGAAIDRMDDAVLAGAVLTTDVFARTSPEHKLRLVTALQAHGLSVAMTGDGVNDAPALKRADAGIAMGRKGSDAAKEASDLVLADDNFATIAAAVREGRTVYDNIRKLISWTLPTDAGEAMTVAAALLLGLPLPVTPLLILWVNLVTSITLGLALAFEPTEENTMHRPPRRLNEPLIGSALVWHIAFVSLLFLAGVFGIYSYAIANGLPERTATTMALNTLVVFEIFHLFFIRNIYGTSLTWKAVRGTPAVWTTVIIITAAQFAITYLPPMQAVFGTAPVPLAEGLIVVALGAVFFILLEIEKQLRLSLIG